ncbi:MAG: TIGR02646 family protein [Muribaculaceae bacterium]|nr:TIGR02646 family protein [Muribaculaceae bacterium]
MKRIVKNPAHTDAFNSWASQQGFTNWDQFTGSNAYHQVRSHVLFNEQYGISGYTEEPLDNPKLQPHIDHYRKKGIYPRLTFEYENFVVDYHRTPYGSSHKDKVVNGSFNYADIFDPVHDDMSQYIQFGPHGEMMPEYNLDPLIKAKVDKTIEVFDLNNNLLNSKRYGIMCVLESYAGMESDIILECMQAAGFPSLVNWWLRTHTA